MNDEGLLPCPFCGDEDPYCDGNNDGVYVECGFCGATIANFQTQLEATEEWNKRAHNKSNDYQQGYLKAIDDGRFALLRLYNSQNEGEK